MVRFKGLSLNNLPRRQKQIRIVFFGIDFRRQLVNLTDSLANI